MEETIVRDATSQDWLYIDSLRKKEGASLGFIPEVTYQSVLERRVVAGRKRWKYQRLIVTVDNNELTGFCYYSLHDDLVTIIQIVVQPDARRWYRAALMVGVVEGDAQKAAKYGITCRVAVDLESNFFWRAMGYEPVDTVVSTYLNRKESKSKRPLFVYIKRWFPLFGDSHNMGILRVEGVA